MDEVLTKFGVEIFTKICDSKGPPFASLLGWCALHRRTNAQ